MADVVYTINYDTQNGLMTSQGIEVIGTSRDRVRFVTQTPEQKVALQRDQTKNPNGWPLKGLPDPYLVPSTKDAPHWIDVDSSGRSGAFHYICGYINDKGEFKKWSDSGALPVERRSAAAVQRAPASSLPWPVG
jgi:hypothetical protein